MAGGYIVDLEERQREKLAAAVQIRVDSYDGRIARGSLCSLLEKNSIPFCGLDQAVLMIEELLDREAVLEHEGEYRRADDSFDYGSWLDWGESEDGIYERERLTIPRYREGPQKFLIRVHGRYFQTIQGEIRMEGKRCYFRSGMELMRLMHQRLQIRYRQAKQKNLSFLCNI